MPTKSTTMFSTSMTKRLHELDDHGDPIASKLLYEDYLVKDGIHHITMRNAERLISYCPKGKEQEVNPETNKWIRKGRQTMKLGKMVRTILIPEVGSWISDNQIERFTYRMLSTDANHLDELDGDDEVLPQEPSKPLYEFRLVEGNDLLKCYLQDNYLDTDECKNGDECSLWSSCMRYENTQYCLSVYAKNSTKVQMLVQWNNEHDAVMGRALVWTLDNGRKFMDRIYCSDDAYIDAFQSYAIKQGWLFKTKQSNDSYRRFYDASFDKQLRDYDIKVSIPGLRGYEELPYMDTLLYANFKEGYLTNRKMEGIEACLRETGGGWEEYEGGLKADEFNGDLLPLSQLIQPTIGKYKGMWVPRSYCTVGIMYDENGERTEVVSSPNMYDDFVYDCVSGENVYRNKYIVRTDNGDWTTPENIWTTKCGLRLAYTAIINRPHRFEFEDGIVLYQEPKNFIDGMPEPQYKQYDSCPVSIYMMESYRESIEHYKRRREEELERQRMRERGMAQFGSSPSRSFVQAITYATLTGDDLPY